MASSSAATDDVTEELAARYKLLEAIGLSQAQFANPDGKGLDSEALGLDSEALGLAIDEYTETLERIVTNELLDHLVTVLNDERL